MSDITLVNAATPNLDIATPSRQITTRAWGTRRDRIEKPRAGAIVTGYMALGHAVVS
jgi:hypothetical protein